MNTPRWKKLADEYAGGLFGAAARILDPSTSKVPDFAIPPQLAVFHLNACLNASILAIAQAQPSVAVCMLRQCVESLTLVDLGLQEPDVRDPLMES